MSECIGHTGLFDDNDNPLNDDGSFFMPGKRFCNHRDCVNPDHIEGLAKRRPYTKRHPKFMWAAIHDEIMQIGMTGKTIKGQACQVSVCSQPSSGRGLCASHWLMFRKRKPEVIQTRQRLTLADFPPVPPTSKPNERLALKNAYPHCTFKNCNKPVMGRALCEAHLKSYRRLSKASK